MNLLKLNGAELRKLRESLNWTREFLSEKSEVPTRTIQDIEMGMSKNPGIETIRKMILAMDPDYGKEAEKAESVLAIISALPALNDLELKAIATRVNSFLARKSGARISSK